MSARAAGLMVMSFLITSFGTLALAAYGVSSNVLQVVMIPAMGLSMAISTLVGQNIGARNIERAAAIGRLGALIGFAGLGSFGLLVFLFPRSIVAFFVPNDAAVIEAGAGCLPLTPPALGFLRAPVALPRARPPAGDNVVAMWM